MDENPVPRHHGFFIQDADMSATLSTDGVQPPAPRTLTGAQVLVEALRVEGVQLVFGIVGGKLSPFFHALSQAEDIRFIGVRHEASAAMMAAAHYAATGQMAVAVAEMGPGALNLASGLGMAFNNHLPVLAITSNQHQAVSYPHRGMFMDLDSCAVTRPVTKWNAYVHDGQRILEVTRQAFREALSGRGGPVHLDFAHDALSQPVTVSEAMLALAPASYRPVSRPAPASADIGLAMALIADARRPVLVAGGGAVQAGAVTALRAFAERLGAPVIPTQMGLGCVASSSPHFIGHGGIIGGKALLQALHDADLVISVGCRWSSWMWDERGALVRPEQKHININIDPSALGRASNHALAIWADARHTLEALLAAPQWAPVQAASEWLGRLRGLYEQDQVRRLRLAAQEATPMHPAALAQRIAALLPSDCRVVFDGGHTSFWSNEYTPVEAPRTRLHEPGMSHLGFGLPAALAIQAAYPDRLVVNITGDGAFGFTLNELDTARRYGLPVLTIIHNNEAWGVIQMGQKKSLDFEFGSKLEGSDYAAIARGFGCFGERVETLDAFVQAYARARASGLPAVLDCRTAFEPHPMMGSFASMNKAGSVSWGNAPGQRFSQSGDRP